MNHSTNVSRRRFMHSSVAAPAFLKTVGHRRPNILLITCDQLRNDALSCTGNPSARTPNLACLAREGVYFENAFATSALCVPSRTSLNTGLYPHRHGILQQNNGQPGANCSDLSSSIVSMLREQDYRTGLIGRNGFATGQEVLKYFDHVQVRNRESYRYYPEHVPAWWHGDHYWPTERCYSALNTDDAIKFIGQGTPGRPFFLSLNYHDPHPPYMAPSEYVQQFDPHDMRIPDFVPAGALCDDLDQYMRGMQYHLMTESDLRETMRYYHAQVLWIDALIGNIIDSLNRLGMTEDTLICLTADHGDFLGEHWMTRKGMFFYDALLRVPLLWYGPGMVQPFGCIDQPASLVDILPTLADLLRLSAPTELSGQSLQPHLSESLPADPDHAVYSFGSYGPYRKTSPYILEGGPIPEEFSGVALHTRIMQGTKEMQARMASVRTLRWRYNRTEGQPDELYHYEDEWQERKNLINHPEAQEQRRALSRRLDEVWPWL